jgi:hypothetical protein
MLPEYRVLLYPGWEASKLRFWALFSIVQGCLGGYITYLIASISSLEAMTKCITVAFLFVIMAPSWPKAAPFPLALPVHRPSYSKLMNMCIVRNCLLHLIFAFSWLMVIGLAMHSSNSIRGLFVAQVLLTLLALPRLSWVLTSWIGSRFIPALLITLCFLTDARAIYFSITRFIGNLGYLPLSATPDPAGYTPYMFTLFLIVMIPLSGWAIAYWNARQSKIVMIPCAIALGASVAFLLVQKASRLISQNNLFYSAPAKPTANASGHDWELIYTTLLVLAGFISLLLCILFSPSIAKRLGRGVVINGTGDEQRVCSLLWRSRWETIAGAPRLAVIYSIIWLVVFLGFNMNSGWTFAYFLFSLLFLIAFGIVPMSSGRQNDYERYLAKGHGATLPVPPEARLGMHLHMARKIMWTGLFLGLGLVYTQETGPLAGFLIATMLGAFLLSIIRVYYGMFPFHKMSLPFGVLSFVLIIAGIYLAGLFAHFCPQWMVIVLFGKAGILQRPGYLLFMVLFQIAGISSVIALQCWWLMYKKRPLLHLDNSPFLWKNIKAGKAGKK